MKRALTALLLLIGVLAVHGRARADIIVLASGRQIQGRAVRVGEMLRIEIKPGAAIIVHRKEVVEIRPGTWADEYRRRLGGLAPDDATAHFRLAAWCKLRGLVTHCEAQVATVLSIKPDHKAALSLIAALRREKEIARKRADERAPPGKPQKAPDIAAKPQGFSTAHVTAVSDGEPGTAKLAAEEGEKAITRLSALLGIVGGDAGLKAFRVRLRHYSSREKYLEAARKAGVTGNSGFYSARDATCHVLGDTDGKLHRDNLRSVRHEVTHAFLWKVMGISSADPWLHEALATWAEGDGQKNIAGPRLWFMARSADSVNLSVRGLQASTFKTGTLGEKLLNYSRVWSFAHFMIESGDAERRKTFVKMLSDCRGWGTDIRAVLKKHFPDTAKLEAAWRCHVNRLISEHLPKRFRATVPVPATDMEEYRSKVLSPRRELPPR